MAIELRDPSGDVGREWITSDAELEATGRILLAMDGLDQDRRTRDRAHTIGMGRVFVTLIGVAMVLAVVVTLNQLISDAVRAIEQGM